MHTQKPKRSHSTNINIYVRNLLRFNQLPVSNTLHFTTYALVILNCSLFFRITSTKCRINTAVSPYDGHIVARNMYRKEINILRKIVRTMLAVFTR